MLKFSMTELRNYCGNQHYLKRTCAIIHTMSCVYLYYAGAHFIIKGLLYTQAKCIHAQVCQK